MIGREDAADEHDEHHRIADLHARIELAERVDDRAAHDLAGDVRRPACRDDARCRTGRGLHGLSQSTFACVTHDAQPVADHLQVLDDRAERQRRHERQRTDQQHDADQHRDEQRRVRRQRAGRHGDVRFLAARLPAIASTGIISQ